MKKFSLSILAISSAVILTACGGSSGGGEHTSTPMINSGNSTNSKSTNPSINAKITGKSLVIKTNDSGHGVKQVSVSSDDIYTLVVDGRQYSLGSPNIMAGTFIDINQKASHSVISGTHLSHAKYGYWRDKQAGMEYFFYQGEKTPVADMSKLKGKVDYTGQALQYGELGGDGTANFTANFDNKTIAGTISNSKTTVKLTADIKGNTFVNDGSKTGVQVDGAFFGKNAEELSGIYMGKNKDFAGAFGAKKQ